MCGSFLGICSQLCSLKCVRTLSPLWYDTSWSGNLELTAFVLLYILIIVVLVAQISC